MNLLWKKKLRAFGIHLMLSTAAISVFLMIATQVWYPDILFKLENVWQGLQILLPVDAILGPLLTLILFVPGKKGLMGDLIIVATIQIAALAYGGSLIYQSRPEIMVFAGDRFEIIPAIKFQRNELLPEHFKDSVQEDGSYAFPHVLYALPGQTADERSEFVLNNVQYQKLPERYRPLIDFKSIVTLKALSVEGLTPNSKASEKALAKFHQQFDSDQVLLFALDGTTKDTVILILDKQSLANLGYLDLDPWQEHTSL